MLKVFFSAILIMISTFEVAEAKEISKSEIIRTIKSGSTATKKLLERVPIDYYKNNNTLLHYAVQFRKRDVVQLLVHEKIDLSRKGGKFYGTALQEAIHYGYLGIASYLLKEGTRVNIQNKYGETALHIAAKNGYLSMVNQLLAHGASKQLRDNNGNLPYDLIPDLSWDSRKALQDALRVDPSDLPSINERRSRINIDGFNQNIDSSRNNNINIIDKKTKIDKSDLGININIHRINNF